MTTVAEVRLWGRTIGAVSISDGEDIAAFEYDPAFAKSGIEISPLMMPLSRKVFRFPALSRQTFYGLPGLLADSLPDKFGNALISSWLASQGRQPDSFNAVERLCYTGTRGMGALDGQMSIISIWNLLKKGSLFNVTQQYGLSINPFPEEILQRGSSFTAVKVFNMPAQIFEKIKG